MSNSDIHGYLILNFRNFRIRIGYGSSKIFWIWIRSWKINIPSPLPNTCRDVRTLIFWVRIQSCFENFESESTRSPVPTRHKQSDSCLTPGNYKSCKQPVTFFQQTQNPNPIQLRLQERKLTPDPVGCSRSPVSSEISDLLNFWLHAMCACTESYSTYQIRWENWWLGFRV